MTPPRNQTTYVPPPPDPLDAAEHFHEKAKRSAAEFRYADDSNEPSTATGQHPPLVVLMPQHPPQPSAHELEAQRKPNAGGLTAAIVLLATAAVAVCKALGWIP